MAPVGVDELARAARGWRGGGGAPHRSGGAGKLVGHGTLHGRISRSSFKLEISRPGVAVPVAAGRQPPVWNRPGGGRLVVVGKIM